MAHRTVNQQDTADRNREDWHTGLQEGAEVHRVTLHEHEHKPHAKLDGDQPHGHPADESPTGRKTDIKYWSLPPDDPTVAVGNSAVVPAAGNGQITDQQARELGGLSAPVTERGREVEQKIARTLVTLGRVPELRRARQLEVDEIDGWVALYELADRAIDQLADDRRAHRLTDPNLILEAQVQVRKLREVRGLAP